MTSQPVRTVWEKLGASSGLWAVLWLGLHFLILQGAAADPKLPPADYVSALVSERMKWEWATSLRVMGGLMIVWFMGSLTERLRLAEGRPGRLSMIAFGVGVVWGSLWLLSAMFNSVGIALATLYQDPIGARLAGVLAREIPLVLTPSIAFALMLATSYVALRFGGFPRTYARASGALTLLVLVLAIIDWYGPGNLATIILVLSFGWMAVTSALVIPPFHTPGVAQAGR